MKEDFWTFAVISSCSTLLLFLLALLLRPLLLPCGIGDAVSRVFVLFRFGDADVARLVLGCSSLCAGEGNRFGEDSGPFRIDA